MNLICKSGRQPDGKNVQELGVCPAPQDTSYDGINGGKNAGRIYWAVTGTFCGGKKQGTFAEKKSSCMLCDFYNLVKKDLDLYAFKFLKPT
ncbi:two-CW domain-containing protein [Candidatus Latescibacterota bacterium]